MKTELAIPQNKPIIPKPTKTEILDAMVRIEKERWLKERAAAKVEIEKHDADFRKKYLKKLIAAMRGKLASPPDLKVSKGYRGQAQLYISVELPLDEEMEAHEKRRDELRDKMRQEFNESHVKARLREGLPAKSVHADRVGQILSDGASRKYLEEVLDAINTPVQPETPAALPA